ncbi:LacI family transcriptional regulator [Paracoccus sp. M683]|uniref:LacI family DNA-binding transcriptional regulator n=1 Tax=Paracoccus sp. M683 TaxID=2594268 RepID=UPI00117D0EA6|nr:LacI family DNA-binding transcriptional regulator [Paracoccus sp. M683]TRW96605.1 LacI family transcriptional regulator [Paracoccus sp. M683]
MKRRVTLKDIAAEVGVHVSTVSRALDPVLSSTITPEVVSRIRATAEQLGYRPNRIAAGLRTNRTMTVGVMIPDITNVIFPPILRGIEGVLEPLGYATIIVNTDSEAERENRLLNVLRDRGVDGIVHAAVLLSDPCIAHVAEDGLPVITLNRRIENSRIPYIINDEEAGIRGMLQHLMDLGHRQIAHLAGPQELSTGQLRLAAFHKVAAELGLDRDELQIAEARRFDEAEGSHCAQQLLRGGRPFTAILGANDRLALGAIEGLRAHGISCPEDVSVTGFNDMCFLDLIRPRLTTVRIQKYDAGRTAAQLLLKLMASGGGDVPLETVLPVEIVIRESTARCPELDHRRRRGGLARI